MTDTAKRLYDAGRSGLASRFNADAGLVSDRFLSARHQPHPSIWYAACLLREGAAETAERVINAALDLQERREEDPHRGNFFWHREDGVVIDLNACQFVLEAILGLPGDQLSAELETRIRKTVELAFEEAERLDVHWTYTNIALLDIHNRILGGERWGLPDVIAKGIERLRAWAERTQNVGAPHEFNSPTYAAVDLNCLADVANRSQSDEARRLALDMEQLTWRHVAQYWHAPTKQLSGPHSRAYRRDVVGAPGFLKVVLYRVLADEDLLAKSPWYEGPDSEGEVIVSQIEYHPPEDVLKALTTSNTRFVRETVAEDPQTVAIAHITPDYALGTLSRPYGVGAQPEPWPQSNSCIAYWKRDAVPGHGVFYCRYRVNAGRVGEPSRSMVPKWMDMWDDGVYRCAQADGHAIVAYGIPPRGQRPIDSWRLDIRLLGPGPGAFTVAGEPWDGEQADLTPAVPVVVADSRVFIGIIPLAPTNLGHTPPLTLWVDGDETVLSMVNYEGPPKQFWEYRSLAGPFFKGNVRSGFALRIGERDDFASGGEFLAALTETRLSDVTVKGTRTIEFGDLRLEYDLRSMWP